MLNLKVKIRNPELQKHMQLVVDTINTNTPKYGAPNTTYSPETEGTVEASCTFYATGVPVEGETFTLTDGHTTETFTFVAERTKPFDIQMGDYMELLSEISQQVGLHSTFVTVYGVSNDLGFQAKKKGIVGNYIQVSDTIADTNLGFKTTSLEGGVGGSILSLVTVGAAGEMRYTEDSLYLSVEASTETESNWKTVAALT